MANPKFEYHEYADLFPLLEGEPFDALVADIKEHGQLESIWLCEGKILDGRNRYRACLELGLEPRFTEYTRGDPLSFVISVNVMRRNLTLEQKAMLTLAVRDVLEAEAKERRGRRTDLEPVGLEAQMFRSSEQAAKMIGIGEHTARRLWSVADKAPELLPRIKTGELAISTAAELAMRFEDNAGRRARVARVVVGRGSSYERVVKFIRVLREELELHGERGFSAALKEEASDPKGGKFDPSKPKDIKGKSAIDPIAIVKHLVAVIKRSFMVTNAKEAKTKLAHAERVEAALLDAAKNMHSIVVSLHQYGRG